MHNEVSFQKEPHKTASKLVNQINAASVKLPPEIAKTVTKLDFLLNAAYFRHVDRFDDDEEE